MSLCQLGNRTKHRFELTVHVLVAGFLKSWREAADCVSATKFGGTECQVRIRISTASSEAELALLRCMRRIYSFVSKQGFKPGKLAVYSRKQLEDAKGPFGHLFKDAEIRRKVVDVLVSEHICVRCKNTFYGLLNQPNMLIFWRDAYAIPCFGVRSSSVC